MNLNYSDLLEPISERYNREVLKFIEFFKEKLLLENHFYETVKNRYGTIDRIVICSKTSNRKSIDIYVYMDANIDVYFSIDQKNVRKKEQIPVWSPSDLSETFEEIKSFLNSVPEVIA